MDPAAESPESESGALWRVLRHPRLRTYVLSRFAASMADRLFDAAVLWLVYEREGKPWLLGMVGLMALPGLVLGLFAGVWADRVDRRKLSLLFQAAAILVMAALAFAEWHGALSLAVLFAGIVLLRSARSMDVPSRQALLESTVPAADFHHAVIMNSAVQNLGWVTGPVACGFLLDAGGALACLVTVTGLFAASFVAFSWLAGTKSTAHREPMLQAIRHGLSFVRHRPTLWGSMALDLVAVVFASVNALLPMFAEILHVGPRGYGLLAGALEVGIATMSLLLMVLPSIQRPGRALLGAVLVYGSATVAFGVSEVFWLSFLCLVAAGMADQVSMASRSLILQIRTPDRLRGRVLSVSHVFIGASNSVGTVESGVLAQFVGAASATVLGGAVCVLTVAAPAVGIPAMRRDTIRDLWADRRASDGPG